MRLSTSLGLGGALAFEFFAADHITGAGVFEYIGLRRIAEPVADHAGRVQLHRGSALTGCRLKALSPSARACRPVPSSKFLQAFVGAVIARQATALHTARDLGTKGNQHAGFAAKLVQGGFQRRRRDVIRLGIGRHHGGRRAETQAGAQ